ncbi:FCD domain-containing protein [Parasphingorhabdus pacifica]
MNALDQAHSRLREFSAHELREIADQHAAISGHAAFLAAERAAEADVAALHTVASQLGNVDTPEACRQADGRFHIEVAAAAQSSRLTQQEIALQAEISELLWLPRALATSPELSMQQHLAIVRAIRDGDGIRARDLAEEHVQHGIGTLVELHRELAAGRVPVLRERGGNDGIL